MVLPGMKNKVLSYYEILKNIYALTEAKKQ